MCIRDRSRRDAFRSIDSKPFACVDFNGKKIEYLRDDYRKRGRGRVVPDTKINDNVALLYAYPGIKPSVIKSVGRDHDGLVIAGTGLGHVPTNPFGDRHAKSILPEIESLIKSGVPVAVAPQTIYGRLNMNVYTAGRMLKESGVIGDGCDWTPECALVKMMFVLGHTKTMEKIKKMMLTNYAGEISERSLPQTFLS